jgi:hypothetical protein
MGTVSKMIQAVYADAQRMELMEHQLEIALKQLEATCQLPLQALASQQPVSQGRIANGS